MRFRLFYPFGVIAIWIFSLWAPYDLVQASPEKVLQKSQYTIGILAYRDKASTQDRWQPLADYLNEQLPQYQFDFKVYFLKELELAVRTNDVNFVLTNPSHYVLMAYRYGLTSPLASMLNLEGAFATDRFGGVVFTRNQRDDITSYRDVAGKKVVTPAKTSLGAFQMQAYELLQQGIRLPDDVQMIETGQPHHKAVEAVLSAEADVGFVRTGVLEELVRRGQIDMNQIKLINAQRHPDFPFVTSTSLYPEWPFTALPSVEKSVMRQVATALLMLSQKSDLAHSMGIAGFTLSGDYRSIDLLMRELRLEPFDEFELSVKDLIDWWLTEIAVALFLFLLAITWFIIVLLKRQRQLGREKRRLIEALEQIRLLNQATEQSPQSILITNTQAKITYMNPAFEDITGYKMAEAKGKNPRILQSGHTPPEVYEAMWHRLNKGKVWRGELLNKRKDGVVYPSQTIMSPVKDERGQTTHFLAIQRDISEKKQREKRIEELLYLDELTGIANRNKLLMLMDQVVHDVGGVTVKGCLVLINLSRFKFINEIHGTDIGDEVLKIISQRLQQTFGDYDVVARLGADQFAVFCKNTASFSQVDEWLMMMGQRALTSMAEPLTVKGEVFQIEANVGVAAVTLGVNEKATGDAINQAFNQAGMAIKEARQNGEHGLKVFNAEMLAHHVERHRLQLALADGIKKNQLRLFVQPQFSQDQKLVGLECLVRWQHPKKGLMLPGRFIPLAEESDLIVTLGDWTLAQACLILSEVQKIQPDLRVAVNVSPRHFRQNNFVERCQYHLDAANACADGLMIEITESLFLDQVDEVVNKMNQLKALGIRFSIDDFGTGYSSMSYLQQLPVDELKIDRAFILAMDRYGVQRSLVSSIYVMARQLQLKVVAEGIETHDQYAQLSEFEHMEMQGFLFAKPQNYPDWFLNWQDQ
ncbi:MAG: EAL domain-containing protein [Hydrogenovibrio sp.]|uniref:EAL domain-containing protein n=1 Tax=Hydrogenovibrio sp. TaxID=2065821 RepID=UPI0028703032|nr:EAL domain-containing protein [Hydrogenovibrio sp.]MDR9499827.1 EAL domain-containing protein [Hydrogenovibrio sp.]